jgi:uncharacterized membrane protein YhaH (DUF805 family)
MILSFKGRADRRTYFITTILLYVLIYGGGFALIISLLSLDVALPDKDVQEFLSSIRVPVALAWLGLVAGVLACLVAAVGAIAISVRRLHDMGFTGFLFLLYPLLKSLAPQGHWPDMLPGPADLIWDVIMIAAPGRRGPNAFGSDPRAAATAAAPASHEGTVPQS